MAGKHRAVSAAEKTCSVEGCEKPHLARGWCSTHLSRWYRRGDPLRIYTPEERGATTKAAHAARTPEERSASTKAGNAARTPEERSASAKARQAAKTPAERSAISRAANAVRTPEERSASAKARAAAKTPAERSAIAKARQAAKTPEELSAFVRRGSLAQRLGRMAADPVAMSMLDARNPRRAKLIRLAFHPATPIYEKRRALDKLTPAPEVQA